MESFFQPLYEKFCNFGVSLSHSITDSFPRIMKAQANKTGNNFMLFILLCVENCRDHDSKHDFSV